MAIQQDFNPRDHIMNIKHGQTSNEYLPVQWRLVWFRDECPDGTIETELVHLDLDRETQEEVFVWNPEKRRSEKVIKTAKGIAIFKATVRNGRGGVAIATKMERAAAFGDWLEKAETGAIGRALGMLGYGTQFMDDELAEHHRIVDSPVENSSNQPDTQASNQHPPRTHPEAQQGEQKSAASTTQAARNTGRGDSQQNASAHSSAKPSKPADPLTVRARGLYDLAIKKGKLKQGAAMDAWLTLCGDLVGANIMAIEHLTASRLDTIEQKLQQAS